MQLQSFEARRGLTSGTRIYVVHRVNPDVNDVVLTRVSRAYGRVTRMRIRGRSHVIKIWLVRDPRLFLVCSSMHGLARNYASSFHVPRVPVLAVLDASALFNRHYVLRHCLITSSHGHRERDVSSVRTLRGHEDACISAFWKWFSFPSI